MQIVINIDGDTYKDIKKGKVYSSIRDVPQESVLAIANGTPLPKNHGRLIDIDAVWNEYPMKPFIDLITDAPAIIEAESESEDKK